MRSHENLQAAFSGESQAQQKYLAFAKKADHEGRPQIAKLFRAAAAAETVHSQAHFRVMKGVKSTSENLRSAIDAELYEFCKMYPDFVTVAEGEGDKGALASFRNALTVEKTHHGLFTAALEALNQGKDLPPSEIWVCDVCGHTHVGNEAPEQCPVCNALKRMFARVE